MRTKLFLLAIVLSSIACGMQAPKEATRNRSETTIYVRTQSTAETSTDHFPDTVKMIVTASTLNVRECAGTGCAVIGELQRGQVVTCTDFDTPAEGVFQWCEHSTGWSSMQFMEVAE